MGLVILPVMLLAAVAWFAVTLLVAALFWVAARRLPLGRVVAPILATVVLPLSWYLPNLSALRLQDELDRETFDCGWTVTRTVESVPGVYAEFDYGDLTRIYSVVQRRLSDGRVLQLKGSKAGAVGPPVFLPTRTLRYGLRDVATLTAKLRRLETQVVDFDTQEVMARGVRYELLSRRNPRSVLDYAIYHLMYQPEECRLKPKVEWETQIRRILAPSL